MKWLLIIFTLTTTAIQAQEPGDLYLGFSTMDSTGENKFDFDQFKELMEIEYIPRPSAGAFVSSVESKSAPVQFGDIIFMVEKEKVKSSSDFQRVSENLKIDETVKMRIRRPVQKSKSGKFKWDTMTVHLTPKTYLEYVKGKMRVEDDKKNKVTTIYHSEISNNSYVNLKIHSTSEGLHALGLQFSYIGDDWIDLTEVIISTDKKKHSLQFSPNEIKNETVALLCIESCEELVVAKNGLIEDIIDSKKVNVLLSGKNGKKEFNISDENLKHLREMVMVFDSMVSK